MANQASVIRKNPFPAIAHAARLGPEIKKLTVNTAQFAKTLELVNRRSNEDQPVALIVVGEAGSGKTHFLRYVEDMYKTDRAYNRVSYLQSPGESFTQLATNILDKLFDPATLKLAVYRLIAFPVIEVGESKARSNKSAAKENRELIKILRTNPERVFAYWDRFSKSEIFNASLMSLEKISRSGLFFETIDRLLRDMRDDRQVDFSGAHEKLVDPDAWKEAGDADSDAGAIRMLESVFALYELLDMRFMVFVDECQFLLNTENQGAKNDMFRKCINAAPRSSVLAFAMRTSDWVAFRDPATERRVLYSKIAVKFEEACSILRLYIKVKSENSKITSEMAREYFDDEVVRKIWESANRVIGKSLRLSYLVMDRVLDSKGEISIAAAVEELTSDRAELDAERAPPDVRVVLEEVVNALELPLVTRKNYDNFDYVLSDEKTSEPALVIGLLEAADDQDEAKQAYQMVRRFGELSKNFPGAGMVVVRTGYASSTVERLLDGICDRVFDAQLQLASLAGQIEKCAAYRLENRNTVYRHKIEGVMEQLKVVVHDRSLEDLRLQQEVSRVARPSPEVMKKASSVFGLPTGQVLLLALVGFFVLISYWVYETTIRSDRDEARAEFELALNKLGGGSSAIRSSGIRALARIAETSRVDFGIQEILVEYIKENIALYHNDPETRIYPSEIGLALEVLADRESWRRPDNGRVSFAGANLAGINLSGFRAEGWIFTRATLLYAKAIGASLPAAVFNDASFDGSNFRDAMLIGADFRGATFVDANFGNANLEEANLSGTIIRGASFRGANLLGADFSGAEFTDADFAETNLRGANLMGARFDGANFDGADLTDAQVPRDIFEGAKVTPRTKLPNVLE